MTRETVEREIARLDAVSRTRALDELETVRLNRLICIERKYDRTRAYPPRPPKPKRDRRARRTIVERLDATIERMLRESLSIRAIYLTAADRAELAAAGVVAADRPAEYRRYPVRVTKSATKASVIYAVHGIARSVWIGGGR